jgi:hypothetical protein
MVMFYGDCMKMCEDFTPKLRQQKSWLLHHNNTPSYTFFFARDFFAEDNMIVIPHSPYFSLFPQLKVMKGCHFVRTEVMETESQVVLNTLTEHDFQDAF